jgi:hypothetical protein
MTVKDVRTEHCCARHGCRYADKDSCTVTNGIAPQSFPCESCDFDRERVAEVAGLPVTRDAVLGALTALASMSADNGPTLDWVTPDEATTAIIAALAAADPC